MENKNVLTFLKCFCCSKTFKVEDLIEMNTNSLMIGSETMDFHDLILDVCLSKVLQVILKHLLQRLMNFFISDDCNS